MHIKNGRKVAFSPGEVELACIGRPFFKRCFCAEISVDDIVGNLPNSADVGMIFFLRTFAAESHLVHQSLDSFMIDLMALIHQLMIDPSDAVRSVMVFKNSSDSLGKRCIPFGNEVWFIDFKVISRTRHSHGL